MVKKNNPLSILFIGNSFSYYHALPKLLVLFAQATSRGNLMVDGVFRGGATLKMLWDEGKALKKLRSRNWDYVVLQERGRLGGIIKNDVVHVGKPQTFISYVTRFDKEIKKAGAKMILYCPPAFLGTGALHDAQKMQAIYVKLARRLRVMVVPSVAAFLLASQKKPTLNLYEPDGYHQNSLGTYLIASLFYKKLFQKPAYNLPLQSYVSRSQQISKKPKIVKLSETDARFLWSIANQIK